MAVLYEKVQLDDNLPMRLIDLYFEKEEPAVEKHWHRSLEILVPIIGGFEIIDNGEESNVQQGSVYIVNSRNIHSIYPDTHTLCYKGYALQIQYDYLKTLLPGIDQYYFQQPTQQINSKILPVIFAIINTYDSHHKYKNICIQGLLQVLISTLFQEVMVLRTDACVLPSSHFNKKILEITQYIDEHYTDDLMINDIAEYFHISSGYLSTFFKKNYKMTIKEYLNLVRLKHAKEDLINTDMSIIDISYTHGFPNPKSFLTLFKRKYGMTPLKYREKMRK